MLFANVYLHCHSVVEASIGVICSSVPHLPALFRRHASDFSHISHLLHGLLCSWRTRLNKRRDLPLHDSSGTKSKAITSQRIQVGTPILELAQGFVYLSYTFSTSLVVFLRVIGNCSSGTRERNVITAGRFSRLWGARSSTDSSANVTPFQDAGPTIRDYHETVIDTEVVSSRVPAQPLTQTTEGSMGSADGKHSGDPSDAHRKGYWDMMSIFRSRKGSLTTESKSYP